MAGEGEIFKWLLFWSVEVPTYKKCKNFHTVSACGLRDLTVKTIQVDRKTYYIFFIIFFVFLEII